MQKEFLLSLGLASVFSCFLFCFVFFILDDDETRAMLAALLVKKFNVHLLFACSQFDLLELVSQRFTC